MKKASLLLLCILSISFIFRNDIGSVVTKAAAQKSAETSLTQLSDAPLADSKQIEIVNRWELPSVLLEVSGIAYLDEDRIACLQDEKGILYIFNKTTGNIEKEITFADPGDFEGLTLSSNTAFAVRSDGVIYEIDLRSGKSKLYETHLTQKNNIEGIALDAANNRLLLAGKDAVENYPGYKCIYTFDLNTKTLLKEPAFKISDENALLKNGKKTKALRPSGIAIHPQTLDIFIVDGPSSRLLQLSNAGKVKKSYTLGKAFQQPEGITLSPSGRLYLSNEGSKNKPGNIIEIRLPE